MVGPLVSLANLNFFLMTFFATCIQKVRTFLIQTADGVSFLLEKAGLGPTRALVVCTEVERAYRQQRTNHLLGRILIQLLAQS